MKGTPYSLWLSMAHRTANQAAGFWAGTLTAAARRNQKAMLRAMTNPPTAAQPKPKRSPKGKAR